MIDAPLVLVSGFVDFKGHGFVEKRENLSSHDVSSYHHNLF
jgi:hypothetical protein